MQIYGGSDWRNKTYSRMNVWQLQQAHLPPAHKTEQQRNAELSVGDIGLSSRVANQLEEASVFTVQDLLAQQEDVIEALSFLGARAMKECCRALRNLGFDNQYCHVARKPKRR